MPDTRAHRGPHPQDAELFHQSKWPDLQAAVADYSWLLGRGYASPSAIKVVGDRYALDQRQRMAVARSSCTDAQRKRRGSRQLKDDEVAGQELSIDGFNVLTTVEVALGGGVIIAARDGTYRDIASVHGTYRKVEETGAAIERVLTRVGSLQPVRTRIYLDSPVGNSGRLAGMIRSIAGELRIECEVCLVNDPDKELLRSAGIVATADSGILDGVARWFNLARGVVDSVGEAVVVPMGGD